MVQKKQSDYFKLGSVCGFLIGAFKTVFDILFNLSIYFVLQHTVMHNQQMHGPCYVFRSFFATIKVAAILLVVHKKKKNTS